MRDNMAILLLAPRQISSDLFCLTYSKRAQISGSSAQSQPERQNVTAAWLSVGLNSFQQGATHSRNGWNTAANRSVQRRGSWPGHKTAMGNSAGAAELRVWESQLPRKSAVLPWRIFTKNVDTERKAHTCKCSSAHSTQPHAKGLYEHRDLGDNKK